MTRNFKVFIDQFIPFLASYDASNSHVSNFFASFSFLPLSLFIESTTADFWIEGAFTFAYTPEGHDFWSRVNKEWRSIAKHL